MSTILHRLQDWAIQSPNAIAQVYKKNFNKNSPWTEITVKGFRDNVLYCALFFESIGLNSNDIGCIFSANCPQWVQFDLGLMLMGAKSAGIYPNSNSHDIEAILRQTEAKIIAIQDLKFLSKLKTLSGNLQYVVVFSEQNLEEIKASQSEKFKILSFLELLKLGKENLNNRSEDEVFKEYGSRLNPKSEAFLIYTSGTTGEPKGALLSHDNLVFTSDLIIETWQLEKGNEKLFSFLPLCHIAEKLQNIGVGISCRYTVVFCSKIENVMFELPQVSPSMLLCVPRVWEKIMEGVEEKISKAKTLQKIIFNWAMQVGQKVSEKKFLKQNLNIFLKLKWFVARKLVIDKIKKALGLSLVKKCASGAAALPRYVAKWYQSLGLEILEDYGQTESTGVICLTQIGVESSGTVGVPPKNIEFKIAEDQEILTKGRHVFLGYYKNESATKEVLDADGWLHTGDLGKINERGLVQIIGRKKEILKTSGGKMIAPYPIEEKIKTLNIISQVCLVGDNRKYITALITLNEQGFKFLKDSHVNMTQFETIEDEKINLEIKKKIDEVNSSLSSYEKIKKFKILSKDFSVEAGELTPTLKLKRGIIEKKYHDIIDKMYID